MATNMTSRASHSLGRAQEDPRLHRVISQRVLEEVQDIITTNQLELLFLVHQLDFQVEHQEL